MLHMAAHMPTLRRSGSSRFPFSQAPEQYLALLNGIASPGELPALRHFHQRTQLRALERLPGDAVLDDGECGRTVGEFGTADGGDADRGFPGQILGCPAQ